MMKYSPIDQKLSTSTLLDAIRRGQIFGIEVVPVSASLPAWRVYIEVITKGLGLHKVAMEHAGRIDFETEAEALSALLQALRSDQYQRSLHLLSGHSTLCRLPHNGVGFIPWKTANRTEFENAPERCLRCWVNKVAGCRADP